MHARSAQQLQQHRFRLIIALVRGQQDLVRPDLPGQTGVTRTARGRLQSVLANVRDVNTLHMTFHVERGTSLHAKSRPVVGVRMQAVIYVNGAQTQRVRAP